MLKEREINFSRRRVYGCTRCRYTVETAPGRIDDMQEYFDQCPECSLKEGDLSWQEIKLSDDPRIQDDSFLTSVSWYHTTTLQGWPLAKPASLNSAGREFLAACGGMEKVEAWEKGRLNDALHLGTYEAAVQNMYRRISRDCDEGKNFYLHRVRVRADSVIRPGWVRECFRNSGRVSRDKICPGEVSVTRYLNESEDPGRISLAIRPEAIASIQTISLRQIQVDDERVRDLVGRLDRAVDDSEGNEDPSFPNFMMFCFDPPIKKKAREIASELSDSLGEASGCELSAGGVVEEMGSEKWVRWLLAVHRCAADYSGVLRELGDMKIQPFVPVGWPGHGGLVRT